MGAFSLATGLNLLYDEGVLPPNPERQALAFASAAEENKLGSDGLALKRTAAALAMEDESANGTVELSPAAMQFLVDDLASPDALKAAPSQTAPQQSGYPYGGWSSVAEPSASPAPTALAAGSGTSINLFG
jgi:hypothetical protein